MAVYKLIHWSDKDVNADGLVRAEVVILTGYTDNTIAHYKRLLEELKQVFPFVNEENVRFGKVHKSRWCCNFTVAQWYGYLEKRDYDGFTNTTDWQAPNLPWNCEYWWQ